MPVRCRHSTPFLKLLFMWMIWLVPRSFTKRPRLEPSPRRPPHVRFRRGREKRPAPVPARRLEQPMTTPGGTIPPHDGQGPLHIGFAVSAEELAMGGDAGEARDRHRGPDDLVSAVGPAFISGIRTGICWSWRRRGSGQIY